MGVHINIDDFENWDQTDRSSQMAPRSLGNGTKLRSGSKARNKLKRKAVQKYKVPPVDDYLATIARIPIKIPCYTNDALFTKAAKHFNEFRERKYETDFTYSGNIYDSTIHRIAVNMLRHQYNHYDEFRMDTINDLISDPLARRQVYKEFKIRILNEIKKVYPILRQECNRQIGNL